MKVLFVSGIYQSVYGEISFVLLVAIIRMPNDLNIGRVSLYFNVACLLVQVFYTRHSHLVHSKHFLIV